MPATEVSFLFILLLRYDARRRCAPLLICALALARSSAARCSRQHSCCHFRHYGVFLS